MAALKKGGSGLMEVDEDKHKIRRCPTVPLPEWNDARREELMNNTVYVKGKISRVFATIGSLVSQITYEAK